MWLKASLDLMWEASGHIPRTALINHLEKFTFQSKAITPFLLERLRNNMLLYQSEIKQLKKKLDLQGIHETIGYTQNLNQLDNFLLGDHNWRNAGGTSIELAERRYLIWVTQLTPRDRMLGWGNEDWKSISPRDLKIFFAVMFNYSMLLATAFYISINQLTQDQLDHRMGLGGLDSIEPTAFLNILRIINIAKNLKEWRDWPTELVIPNLTHINAVQRLATKTDLVKIEMALSIPAHQYLGGISQGEKTPSYY